MLRGAELPSSKQARLRAMDVRVDIDDGDFKTSKTKRSSIFGRIASKAATLQNKQD